MIRCSVSSVIVLVLVLVIVIGCSVHGAYRDGGGDVDEYDYNETGLGRDEDSDVGFDGDCEGDYTCLANGFDKRMSQQQQRECPRHQRVQSLPHHPELHKEMQIKCSHETCAPSHQEVLTAAGVESKRSLDVWDFIGLHEEAAYEQKKNRHGQLISVYVHAEDILAQNPALGDTYASKDLLQLTSLRALARAQRSVLPLHPDELNAWIDFYDAMNGRRWDHCNTSRLSPCTCHMVVCGLGTSTKYSHITALIAQFAGLSGSLPSSIGAWRHMETLDLRGSSLVGQIPSSFAQLTKLKGLSLQLPQPMDDERGSYTRGDAIDDDMTLEFLEPFAQLRHLEILAAGETRKSSALLTSVCGLTALQNLEILGFEGPYPDCLGQLTNLLRLQMNSNHPGTPLPAWLGRLHNLRIFISFHNGESVCRTSDKCRPKYVAQQEYREADTPWICPAGSFTGAIPEELKYMRSIEKFWVDANCISGPIPEWIGTHWTKVRSIDFYNNELSGSIPENLANLGDLEQLQLQDNQLTGVFPKAIAALPHVAFIHVGLNKDLHGCVSGHRGNLSFITSGSQVVEKEECDDSGSPLRVWSSTVPSRGEDAEQVLLAFAKNVTKIDGTSKSSESSSSSSKRKPSRSNTAGKRQGNEQEDDDDDGYGSRSGGGGGRGGNRRGRLINRRGTGSGGRSDRYDDDDRRGRRRQQPPRRRPRQGRHDEL